MTKMTYFPCGIQHDLDVPCFNLTKQILKDAGLREKKHKPRGNFKNVVRKANISLILFILVVAALVPIIGAIISSIRRMIH